jgi:hypothetical protein
VSERTRKHIRLKFHLQTLLLHTVNKFMILVYSIKNYSIKGL